MIPPEEREPFTTYQPGFACTVYGDYQQLCEQRDGTRPRSPGQHRAIFEMTRAHRERVEWHKTEIEAWLREHGFAAQIISGAGSPSMRDYNRYINDFSDGALSGSFLTLESESAMVAFRLRWL